MRGIRWGGVLVVVMAGAMVSACTTVPPGVLPVLTGATQISISETHSCAWLASGEVKCWGSNYVGQLGSQTYATNQIVDFPVFVTGLTDAVSVAAGWVHTCALKVSGDVSCWGYNGEGELGDGTTTDSPTPVDVVGISDATQITVTNTSTCALVGGGAVKCWGWGLLGDGGTSGSSVPVDVVGITGATQIAGKCALLADGTVRCWGENPGDGSASPSTIPVEVDGITDAVRLSDGQDEGHNCAVLGGGAAKCWGSNLTGELGDGTTTDSSVPVSVTVVSGITHIAVGGTSGHHSHTCALIAGGAGRCWGDNLLGALGNGTAVNSIAAVNVVGLTGATQIVADGHTCALVAGGAVKCWGRNDAGQLGNGTMDPSRVPVSVIAGL